MKRIIVRGAHLFLLTAVLSFIIFLSGCGTGGSSWDASYNNGISPSSNKTPQAVIDKAKQENASKGGRAESSPIVLQAGSTATIMGYSAEAGTTSSFGIYQPEERTLTGDTNHAIGQTWTVGPFSEDKNLAFWFQSGVSPPDSKIQLTPSGEGVYYVGCEDLTDNDYNDFVAQVTVKSTPKLLSIEDAKTDPSPCDTYKIPICVKISAKITGTGFTFDPTKATWSIEISDNKGKIVRDDLIGTGDTVYAEWDGKDKDGKYQYDNFLEETSVDNEPVSTVKKFLPEAKYTFTIKAQYTEESLTATYPGTLTMRNLMLYVPEFPQAASEWADVQYDHRFFSSGNPVTIGLKGCALCSYSMITAFYFLDLVGQYHNPLTVNFWLKENNGYCTFEDINWYIPLPSKPDPTGDIKWESIRKYTQNGYGLFGITKDINYDYINDDLKEELPVIVQVEGHHFTVVKGRVFDRYALSDSARYHDAYKEKYFLNDWNLNSVTPYVFRFKRLLTDQPKNMAIYGFDESGHTVEYAIIDPQGRYLGYNPINGVGVEQAHLISGDIPNAQYYYLPWSNPDDQELMGIMKKLWLYQPMAGTYTFKVFGTDVSEHYYFNVSSDHPQDTSTVSINGFINPGQVIEYSLVFSQTPGIAPVVTLKESINGQLELEPKTLNLNSQGNYITAHIGLPSGYNIQDMDVTSLLLENYMPALSHPAATYNHNKLIVKFDRQTLVDYIKSKGISSGEVTLSVTGNVGNTSFISTDKIRVK